MTDTESDFPNQTACQREGHDFVPMPPRTISDRGTTIQLGGTELYCRKCGGTTRAVAL